MDVRPILFPEQQRFACQMCAGCCHSFDVIVNDAELAAFRDFDWAATRARFQGQDLTVPRADGRTRLNRLEGGACIFLDDDNLCAIHKELGLEAKPAMCKQFPYRVVDSPDGLVATLDFACTSVVSNVGAPIQELEGDIRMRVEKWIASGRPVVRAESDTVRSDEPSVEIRRGSHMRWADYLALEEGVRCVLLAKERPLTERVLMADRLLNEAARHAKSGEMAGWVRELEDDQWQAIAPTASARVSSIRQRTLIAPVISLIEGGWSGAVGAGMTASGGVGLAFAIISSKRPIYLGTADAMLELARMPKVRFAQDDPAITDALARFLRGFVARKGLVTGTSLAQGARYMGLYFGLMRWYSVARAAMAERLGRGERRALRDPARREDAESLTGAAGPGAQAGPEPPLRPLRTRALALPEHVPELTLVLSQAAQLQEVARRVFEVEGLRRGAGRRVLDRALERHFVSGQHLGSARDLLPCRRQGQARRPA